MTKNTMSRRDFWGARRPARRWDSQDSPIRRRRLPRQSESGNRTCRISRSKKSRCMSSRPRAAGQCAPAEYLARSSAVLRVTNSGIEDNYSEGLGMREFGLYPVLLEQRQRSRETGHLPQAPVVSPLRGGRVAHHAFDLDPPQCLKKSELRPSRSSVPKPSLPMPVSIFRCTFRGLFPLNAATLSSMSNVPTADVRSLVDKGLESSPRHHPAKHENRRANPFFPKLLPLAHGCDPEICGTKVSSRRPISTAPWPMHPPLSRTKMSPSLQKSMSPVVLFQGTEVDPYGRPLLP